MGADSHDAAGIQDCLVWGSLTGSRLKYGRSGELDRQADGTVASARSRSFNLEAMRHTQ